MEVCSEGKKGQARKQVDEVRICTWLNARKIVQAQR